MNKIAQRLIVFIIGIPALFSALLLFPQMNHLVFNLVIIVYTVLGAGEFKNIHKQKNLVIPMPEAVILGGLSPVSWTVVVSFGVTGHLVAGALVLGASWLLVTIIFSAKENFGSCIGRLSAGLAIILYPGLFMSWIVQMAVFREAGMVIMVFFLVTFLNDAAAWLAGVLFGKNNRGLIPASPGKSIAGFIGGLAASVGTGMLAVAHIPAAFTSQVMPSLLAGALLGFGAGIAAILGDLGESAIKRSAEVKDSGSLILGRGGALDSIDSLILAAPVYYILYSVLFQK
jgi:phosphatidate cytidylyltransferase